MDVERCRVDQQIRAGHQVEPDRTHALADLVGEAMVVAEQVQPGAHRREHVVDLRLPRVWAPSAWERMEWLRRFVSQQYVDVAQPFTGLDLFADEMPTLVVSDAWATRGLKTPGYGRRELRCAGVVPRRRKCSPEPSHPQPIYPRGRAFRRGHLDQGPIRNVMEIRRQIAGRDRVEVVVVAVDPVDRRAKRLIPSCIGRDVPDAEPEGDLGMPRDDRSRGVERAVDVA